MLIVAGLWIASSLFGGRFRFRWSWTDAAVVALMFLVGLSSTRGLDRRLAINLAWEWAGLGFAYVLARNLPRTRGESTVLAGALVATAVAVSAYGLFQARVEIPQLQARFQKNPAAGHAGGEGAAGPPAHQASSPIGCSARTRSSRPLAWPTRWPASWSAPWSWRWRW